MALFNAQEEIDGVSNPINVLKTLYTSPASTYSLITKIVALNRNATTAAKIRVAVIRSGESISDKCYYQYDANLYGLDAPEGGTPLEGGAGMTLAPGDFIQVLSDTEDVNFQVYGNQVQ